jgi:uncharacterized SAM-binding protein YcdF (DUF218 family)
LFFVASKVFWGLAAPANALVALAGAGLLLQVSRRLRKLGQAAVLLSFSCFLLLGILPVGRLLLAPLETRFERPETPPERIRGIVVLGGAVDPTLAAFGDGLGLLDSAERLVEGAALARAHPDAVLVHTGGSGLLLRQDVSEAEAAARVFAALGLPADRVLFESASRNTWENAVLTRELVRPRPGETWLLVTSAFHMPRSVGVFRRAGWDVVPWPVDRRVAADPPFRPGFDVAGGIEAAETAVREWIGLAAYRLAGRTDALFPSP